MFSEIPTGTQNDDAPIASDFFNPKLLRLFRLESCLPLLVQEVAAFKVQRESFEVFFDMNIEFTVFFEEGEECGHVAPVMCIGAYAPAFAQVGGYIAHECPIIRISWLCVATDYRIRLNWP